MVASAGRRSPGRTRRDALSWVVKHAVLHPVSRLAIADDLQSNPAFNGRTSLVSATRGPRLPYQPALRRTPCKMSLRTPRRTTTLARTGRSGGWASYLRSHKLPQATADRYVLGAPRSCSRVEPSPHHPEEAAYRFIHELVDHIPAADYRSTEWGIEVLRRESED